MPGMMAFIDRYRWWLSAGLVTLCGSLFLTYRYLGLLEDFNEQVRQNGIPHKIPSFKEKYEYIREGMTLADVIKLLGKPEHKVPLLGDMEGWLWVEKKQVIAVTFDYGKMVDKVFRSEQEKPSEP
jgi:hypothetical protein